MFKFCHSTSVAKMEKPDILFYGSFNCLGLLFGNIYFINSTTKSINIYKREANIIFGNIYTNFIIDCYERTSDKSNFVQLQVHFVEEMEFKI